MDDHASIRPHGGSTGIKGGNDTYLGDTDRLLFHGFMKNGTSLSKEEEDME